MRASQLIAHRGWQRQYPENSLIAIDAALRTGARHIEIDVQLTRDRVPVLFHDRSLQRLCRQPGAIHNYEFAQLREFSAGEPERFGTRFQAINIASLEEVVKLLAGLPDSSLFLELKRVSLKQFGADAVLDTVLPLLEPLQGRCTLISFDLRVLQRARERGHALVGPVLERWEQLQDQALAALEPAVVFCDLDLLPLKLDIDAPWPLAVYEIGLPGEARALLARGASYVETFAIGELLAAAEKT